MSRGKCAGLDNIPCCLFKYCDKVIAKPIPLIINKSMPSTGDGVFPTQIKTSKVKPIHEKNLVNNYRPVKVQSAFSKVLEIVFINIKSYEIF